MDLREQRRELGVAPGGGRQDLDERADALEPEADVGGEQPQLLALVGGRGDGAGTGLLGHGRRLAPAHGSADELAEQRPLVAKARVDGLGRDPRLLGDGGDRRALEATLGEQPRGGLEHAGTRVLGLLAAPLGAVGATRLDIFGHIHHSVTVSNTVILYRRSPT